ncbi:MAG: MBOAT family protein [Candidatus Amulumruptor caecigallinarius]|nr:MBOAT family protein [Candidatus Amulumruptor caecigallinarius]
MLFDSFAFLIFLPTVFLLYWFAGRGNLRRRNLIIIASSYIFYGWWDWKFLFLIIFTTFCSYFSGIIIQQFLDRSKWKCRLTLWLSVAINIGILFTFKYFDFFALSFGKLLSAAGLTADIVTLNLILPVGISFYTFQALSYTIDVYRRDITATHNPEAFMAFISFFPQLVAGPIERATNLLPQFQRLNSFDYTTALSGMKLILWGLFKKMIIADNCAPVVDRIFANYESAGTLNLWIGAFLFTMQIYGDFSGYSDIAIGSARLFNIKLMRNFDKPYFSRSMHEFWKKWHISLTSWLRDYIYIPLGGNRKGRARTAANVLAVFAISGLWHGANFTYLFWGVYHGILQIPHIVSGKKNPPPRRNIIGSTFALGLTFILVLVGWVLFRAQDIFSAAEYVRLMFSPGNLSSEILGKTAFAWCVIFIIIEFITRKGETPFEFKSGIMQQSCILRRSVYIAVFFITLVFAGQSEAFIYFQF